MKKITYKEYLRWIYPMILCRDLRLFKSESVLLKTPSKPKTITNQYVSHETGNIVCKTVETIYMNDIGRPNDEEYYVDTDEINKLLDLWIALDDIDYKVLFPPMSKEKLIETLEKQYGNSIDETDSMFIGDRYIVITKIKIL